MLQSPYGIVIFPIHFYSGAQALKHGLSHRPRTCSFFVYQLLFRPLSKERAFALPCQDKVAFRYIYTWGRP